MTTFLEYDRIAREVERAKVHGLVVKPARHGGGTCVEIDPFVFPEAAENVVLFSSEQIEDALLFAQGAMWMHEFLRLGGRLKKENKK